MNIRQVKADLAEARADLNAVIRENRGAVDNAGVRLAVATKRAEVKRLEREVSDFKPAKVKVRSEPSVYDRREHDLNTDRIKWALQHDEAAGERLRRAAAATPRPRDRFYSRASMLGARFEGKAGSVVSNRDLSQDLLAGGEFSPIGYEVDLFAAPNRSLAPAWSQCKPVAMPEGVSTIVIPDLSAEAQGGPAPTTQNTGVGADNAETASYSGFVTMTLAQWTVSYQQLDQGAQPLDWISQLGAEELCAAKETALFDASGSGEFTGILAAAGNSVDCTDATSPVAVLQSIAGAAYEVGTARKRAPEAIFVDSGYLQWLLGYFDADSNPVQRPGQPIPSGGAQSTIAGLPVYPDGALPLAAQGTAPAIFVGRPSDVVTFETVPKFEVLAETGGPELSATVRLRQYICAIVRFPSGWSYVEGLTTP